MLGLFNWCFFSDALLSSATACTQNYTSHNAINFLFIFTKSELLSEFEDLLQPI